MILSSRRSSLRGVGGSSWVAVAILALLPATLRAAVTATITAPAITLPYSAASQSGTFELYVQASGSPQPMVSGMQVELQLPSFSAISFISSTNTTPTVHPYIFPNQSPSATIPNSGSGRTVEGADFEQGNTYPTLSNGAGLLLVCYSVPAGASGYYPLSFVDYSNQNPFGNALLDSNVMQIPTTDQSGSITIIPPTAYWRGSVDGIWTTDNLQTGVTNWTLDSAGTTDTHIAPGASTDVFFVAAGAQNLNTTLGADISIKGLTFTSTATAPVVIAGANTLTIGTDGLTVQAGSGGHSINNPVTLGGSQTWQIGNATSSPLTVGGTLTVPAGMNLTKSGTGGLILTGPPTLSNASSLSINGGTLKFNLTSPANIGTGVTATVAMGATLELAGSVSALSSAASPADRVNIVNNSTAAAGGLLISGTNQQVGAITGTGNLSLAAGSSLTANSILQAAIIIGGASGNPTRLTIDASNSSGTSLSGGLGGSGAGDSSGGAGAVSQTGSPLIGSVSSGDSFAAGIVGSSDRFLSSADIRSSSLVALSGASIGVPSSRVPEPSSFGLVAAALGLVWLSRRHRSGDIGCPPRAAGQAVVSRVA
jgi:hypothetical protein